MANLIQAFPRGAGGSGGGAVFAYVDAAKSAFASDWLLKEPGGDAIVPEEGLLYLILTVGEYYNSFYRFDETEYSYVLVSKPEKYSSMPTASADNAGEIVQYVGVTDSSYVHGFFYECVEDSGAYSWAVVKVEDDEVVEISQADFDRLPLAEKNNGKAYFIYDAELETHYSVHTGFTPVGTVISVMGASAPDNYLACDGQVYPIASYPQLAAHFEAQFGAVDFFGGDGESTFAVPDLRGEFLRGTGTNSHVDATTGKLNGSGANVGEHQDATKDIYVRTDGGSALIGNTFDSVYESCDVDTISDSTKVLKGPISGNAGDARWPGWFTSRPTNTSVLWCIACRDVYVQPMLNYSAVPKMVGFWEDGSNKYQVSITGTTISGTSGVISTGLLNLGIVYAELERFQVSNGSYVKNLLDSVSIKLDGSEIAMVADPDSLFTGKTFYATINYKISSV